MTQRFAAPIRPSQRGHAFLINQERRLLWSPAKSLFGMKLPEKDEAFPAFQQILEAMSAGNSGTGQYTYFSFEESVREYAIRTTEEKLIAYAPIHVGTGQWAVGVWAPKQDARQLLRSAYVGQMLVLGSSLLVVLLGATYALVVSSRSSKVLQEEVEAKTQELRTSHETLADALSNLRTANAFQQSVIDGVSDAIMVIDPDYRTRLLNQSARQFASTNGDALEGNFCHQISHGRGTPCGGVGHPCPLDQVRELGRSVTVLHEHHHSSGEQRLVEIIASPLYSTDGAFRGIVECFRDVTERVRSEESLQQYAKRLRALTARLADVADAEQRRLASELHDQVGQNLTALGINLNIIRPQLPEGTPASAYSRLDDSLSLLDETTERVRDLMADLRPPVLDDYGLVAALRWYGERFTRRTGIGVTVDGAEILPRPAVRVESALFRIAQEALINVAKHAQATHARIEVEMKKTRLCLRIADNGSGFDPTSRSGFDEAGGWGLLIIRERAEALGGCCRFESTLGQGARVIVEVPQSSGGKQ